MRIDLPKGEYIKGIEINGDSLEVNFAKKKKVALLFISLNDIYWPYLTQVLKDCRQNFLPQHNVDYFVWTDYSEEAKAKKLGQVDDIYEKFVSASPEGKQEHINALLSTFASTMRLYEVFYPQQVLAIAGELKKQGMEFKRNGDKFWIEATRPLNEQDIAIFYETLKRLLLLGYGDLEKALEGTTISETAAIEWPAPTLMRYHLFLNQEEKLKEYDYIYYMDADMRVVAKISDEIMGDGLTAALHPMYSFRKEYIPPYEPNPDSSAYIKRPGKVVVENGKKRFMPYYYAGGFQGGVAADFIAAMQTMKAAIDKDYNSNYVAVWNDESHWNRYLFDHEPCIVLSPSYIYPDSLIKEYYIPLWGRDYEPKIITLTKPFSLSSEGAAAIQEMINKK